MSAVLDLPPEEIPAQTPRARLVLLGTGTVGSALLTRLAGIAQAAEAESAHTSRTQPSSFETPLAQLRLLGVANSRRQWLQDSHAADADALDPAQVAGALHAGAPADVQRVVAALGAAHAAPRILIDATASSDIAACHALWLRQGIHVVTANKLGIGADAAGEHAIRSAARAGNVNYGDSATVGAGLPLLRSVRALRAGGDRILEIAGIVSGSLGWLFAEFDGGRPFSACLQEARTRGFTEPDARADLSGDDMRRKLLILARAAGIAIEPGDVELESLVPDALGALAQAPAAGDWCICDEPMQQRLEQARRQGRVLRPVIRLAAGGRARVGVETLERDDPLAQSRGCDNRVVIRSTRYDTRPLLIEGPGAGAEITAAALLDDVLEIATAASRRST